MGTSAISITSGTGDNVATYSLSEDAITKKIQRVVGVNSAGTELGTVESPLRVNLAVIGTGTLSAVTTVGSVGIVGNISSIGALVTVGGTINSVSTVNTVASVTSVNTVGVVANIGSVGALVTVGGSINSVITVNTVASITSVNSIASVTTVGSVGIIGNVSSVGALVTVGGTINTVSTVGFIASANIGSVGTITSIASLTSVGGIVSVKNAGNTYTSVAKYFTVGTSGIQPIWTPTAGTTPVLTDLIISVKSSSTVAVLAGNTTICTLSLYDQGGIAMPFTTPYFAAAAGTTFSVNVSASTAYVSMQGYEI